MSHDDTTPFDADPMPVARPLTIAQRAAAALSKEETEKHIKTMVLLSADIKAVSDAEAREACHKAYMNLKSLRVATENAAEKGRQEAVQYSKAVLSIEKELVGLISPEETRLKKLRDEFDAAVEAERQRKIEVEMQRVSEIHRRIEGIKAWPADSLGQSAALLRVKLMDAQRYVVSESDFQERTADAQAALTASVAALQRIYDERVQLEEQQAELAKLRAEAEERERIAAAQREADRIAKQKADAEAEAARKAAQAIEDARLAAEAAKLKAERDAFEKERREAREADERRDAAIQAELAAARAEAKRLQDEEAARIKAAADAEAARLQAEADAKAKADEEAAAKKRKAKKRACPTADSIVTAVATHYGADEKTAREWLASINWADVKELAA